MSRALTRVVLCGWLLWSMHQGTTLNAMGSPFSWNPEGPILERAVCEAEVKTRTGRRFVVPIQWYPNPQDIKTWYGCLPEGFDPEAIPQ